MVRCTKIDELVFEKCGKEKGPEKLLQGGERTGGCEGSREGVKKEKREGGGGEM